MMLKINVSIADAIEFKNVSLTVDTILIVIYDTLLMGELITYLIIRTSSWLVTLATLNIIYKPKQSGGRMGQ